jgi:hypothetical protein
MLQYTEPCYTMFASSKVTRKGSKACIKTQVVCELVKYRVRRYSAILYSTYKILPSCVGTCELEMFLKCCGRKWCSVCSHSDVFYSLWEQAHFWPELLVDFLHIQYNTIRGIFLPCPHKNVQLQLTTLHHVGTGDQNLTLYTVFDQI